MSKQKKEKKTEKVAVKGNENTVVRAGEQQESGNAEPSPRIDNRPVFNYWPLLRVLLFFLVLFFVSLPAALFAGLFISAGLMALISLNALPLQVILVSTICIIFSIQAILFRILLDKEGLGVDWGQLEWTETLRSFSLVGFLPFIVFLGMLVFGSSEELLSNIAPVPILERLVFLVQTVAFAFIIGAAMALVKDGYLIKNLKPFGVIKVHLVLLLLFFLLNQYDVEWVVLAIGIFAASAFTSMIYLRRGLLASMVANSALAFSYMLLFTGIFHITPPIQATAEWNYLLFVPNALHQDFRYSYNNAHVFSAIMLVLSIVGYIAVSGLKRQKFSIQKGACSKLSGSILAAALILLISMQLLPVPVQYQIDPGAEEFFIPYLQYANYSNRPGLCNGYFENGNRVSCYALYSIQKLDPSYCKFSGDAESSNICLNEYVVSRSMFGNSVRGGIYITRSEEPLTWEEEGICEMFEPTSSYKEFCFLSLASKTKDPALCEKVSSIRKVGCYLGAGRQDLAKSPFRTIDPLDWSFAFLDLYSVDASITLINRGAEPVLLNLNGTRTNEGKMTMFFKPGARNCGFYGLVSVTAGGKLEMGKDGIGVLSIKPGEKATITGTLKSFDEYNQCGGPKGGLAVWRIYFRGTTSDGRFFEENGDIGGKFEQRG